MKRVLFSMGCILLCSPSLLEGQGFRLTPSGYFSYEGVSAMAFNDIYPEGRQGGLTLVMNGNRVAANGDVRLEVSQGQWQGLPHMRQRLADASANTITVTESYPDSAKHLTGFNPMIYPDFTFNYTIQVRGESDCIVLSVDLDRPVPEKYAGKVGFNLELFPGLLMGKPWILDDRTGICPPQANGPTTTQETNTKYIGYFTSNGRADVQQLLGSGGYSPMIADDIIAKPYARGRQFVMNPGDPYSKVTFESVKGDLILCDRRMNHQNEWFILRTEISPGVSRGAVEWIIRPNVVSDRRYTPVVQTSQIGYHPNQPKVAVIETDSREANTQPVALFKITAGGEEEIPSAGKIMDWGKFLRYNYYHFDSSCVKSEDLYYVKYGRSQSNVFRIASDVYDRGVWQPTLEYFLPIQMCHMRVNEKYRVWYNYCHDDDARMAPVDLNHIDGYTQGPSTLTGYRPGEIVTGLNIGGWHDVGDHDLRIESQSGEAYIQAMAYENFPVIRTYDETSIDQISRITELHHPDGKPDVLQQVENGALSIVAGYKALGQLYRGIICNSVRQYVHLGDAVAHTNNKHDADDRWVFTEDNPRRELTTAAQLAAMSRLLKHFNDTLSQQCLQIAQELYRITKTDDRTKSAKIYAAAERFLTTGDDIYKDYVLSEQAYVIQTILQSGWYMCRFDKVANDKAFSEAFRAALVQVRDNYDQLASRSPYGLPPDRGNRSSGLWDVQTLGYYYCFYQAAYPEIFRPDYIFDAVNFILGCHPGSNTASFASGVGARSATAAYGTNRADWSYIQGGVTLGTVLIRPDLPEFYDFPFIWQEGELHGGRSFFLHVHGAGSSKDIV